MIKFIRLHTVMACLLTGLFSQISLAETVVKKEQKEVSYIEPWGMAGCGLWSMVIKDHSKWAQLGVWALGFYFMNNFQTSAISSGTSNCVAQRTDIASREQEVFISINLASLTKEAAQGTGEHLSALAEVFGCPHSEFAQLSQNRYGSIYKTYEPTAVLESYRREVQANANLAKTCVRTTV